MRRLQKIWDEMLTSAWNVALSCRSVSLFSQASMILSLATLIPAWDSSNLKMCPNGLMISVMYLVLQPCHWSRRPLHAFATYLTTNRAYETPFVALRERREPC